MNSIVKETTTAIRATLLFAIVLCGVYPVIIWGAAQLLFPRQANGSLIESNDRKIVGSEWLGQNFIGAKYFHPRPSAAGANGYDAASSGGSNLGPTSKKLIDSVKQRMIDYRAENGLGSLVPIPADAVTASGSGLDPHISVKNANFQLARVARTRNLDEAAIRAMVEKFTDHRQFGLLGEAGVNVLRLNLALDAIPPPK
jgi:potassium-transporting ATPase KdpC subunit